MGDILVFLTGQDDIDAAVRLLNEEAPSFCKTKGGEYACQFLLFWCHIFMVAVLARRDCILKHERNGVCQFSDHEM